MAAAHAAMAFRSDPGAAGLGFGSLAYRRAAARTVYDRAAAAAAVAASSEGTGSAGAFTARDNQTAVDSFLQSWDHVSTARKPASTAGGDLGDVNVLCPSSRSSNTGTADAGPLLLAGYSSRSSSSPGTQPDSPSVARSPMSRSSSADPASLDSGFLQHPPYSSLSSPCGPQTSSSASCKTPSKLGRGSCQGLSSSSGTAASYAVWLGPGPLTEQQEAEEVAAAEAEQQYYLQLHAAAKAQAQLHGQLRDTFVLKAYKGVWQLV